jgi:DNA-binding transcriptional MerR regulator
MMPKARCYSTSQIAKLTRVHPNTVRLYEEWGYLSPVPRTESGYRVFSDRHLMEMKIARQVMKSPWAGRSLRQTGRRIITSTVSGDVSAVHQAVQDYLQMIEEEQSMADKAKTAMEKFIRHVPAEENELSLSIHEAARSLKLTKDILRHWERSGVIEIPRNPENRYRIFRQAEIDRLRIIRMLTGTGYSLLAIRRIMQAVDEDDFSDLDLKDLLDHPVDPEEILSTGDRWVATLDELNRDAHQLLNLIQEWENLV